MGEAPVPGSAEGGMESESGRLRRRWNRKGRKEEQGWRSAQLERRQAAGAMDATSQVRKSTFPSP
jgi:hypothetical protein